LSQGPGTRLPERIARLTGSRFELPGRGQLTDGNRVRLLATGEQYFPLLLDSIRSSRRSIHLESYLYEDDAIGRQVTEQLAQAADRGVRVRVIVDGFGSGEHARRLARELGAHGAQVRIYRPERWWRMQRRLFRRLHRKIAVIDQALAFVGGVNIIAEPDDEPARAWISRSPARARSSRPSDFLPTDSGGHCRCRAWANPRCRFRAAPGCATLNACRAACAPRCCCATTCCIAAPSSAPTRRRWGRHGATC